MMYRLHRSQGAVGGGQREGVIYLYILETVGGSRVVAGGSSGGVVGKQRR